MAYISGANSKITSAGGNVNITGLKGINSPSAKDILLETGGIISSTGAGGDITLTSTSGATSPNPSGTDITITDTKTLSFGNNSKINIDIDGTIVDAQYQQLNVAGLINPQ